jgi:hypothetical protein
MTPEEKFELLRTLLERGVVVRTLYRDRRVVAVEKTSERYVLITYADGGVDKMHMTDFARRRFVAVL